MCYCLFASKARNKFLNADRMYKCKKLEKIRKRSDRVYSEENKAFISKKLFRVENLLQNRRGLAETCVHSVVTAVEPWLQPQSRVWF